MDNDRSRIYVIPIRFLKTAIGAKESRGFTMHNPQSHDPGVLLKGPKALRIYGISLLSRTARRLYLVMSEGPLLIALFSFPLFFADVRHPIVMLVFYIGALLGGAQPNRLLVPFKNLTADQTMELDRSTLQAYRIFRTIILPIGACSTVVFLLDHRNPERAVCFLVGMFNSCTYLALALPSACIVWNATVHPIMSTSKCETT